uniref:Phytol kinase n=1 Tax=Paulinella chromatophora TaxID=39717 RepID=B1X4G1_PAUCH|nr:hypothetical protein PCC_0390 [Paulinella chromatophora]ACB42830.1 hypothetical protein PCC_0390 [Paulinella chromatophora]
MNEENSTVVGPLILTLWFILIYLSTLLVRQKWPKQQEWIRKIVHVGMGPVILIAWITNIERNTALITSIFATLAIVLNYRLSLIPAIEDLDRKSYGTIAYGITFTILLWLCWPKENSAIIAGVMVMAFGDGLAGFLGSTYPSPSWKIWGQRKSLIGTISMALISGLVLTILSSFNISSPTNGSIVALLAISTILEQLAISGFDNFIIPVVISFLWQFWTPVLL